MRTLQVSFRAICPIRIKKFRGRKDECISDLFEKFGGFNMSKNGLAWKATAAALAIICNINQAPAADITVLSTVAAHSVVDKVRSSFEQKTGHHLVVRFETAASLKREIETGSKFDVFLLTKEASAALESEGKLPSGKSRPFAVVLLGLAAKEGTSIPDISSPEKLMAALFQARKISYASEGASGKSFLRLLGAHGMLEPLREKLMPLPASEVIEAVASGKVTYGVQLISEIVAVRGATLVAALPTEYQSPTSLTIGCSTDPCARPSFELVEFLSSDAAAVAAIKAAGMEQ